MPLDGNADQLTAVAGVERHRFAVGWVDLTEPPGIGQPNARCFVRRFASGRLLLVKHGDAVDSHERRVKLSAWLSDDDGRAGKAA